MKRLSDIIISHFALVVLLPFILLISVVIKVTSKGPILYKGKRVGINGRCFKIYKFRTMVEDAERMGGPSTPDDDPRLTKIGKVLRKYKFDEIPQLLNVLKGDMSVVGPRPEVLEEVQTYTDEEKKVLLVKPGITDYASILFNNEGEILKGSSNPHQTYREKIRPEKLRLALQYINNNSFLVDLNIIIKTVTTIIRTRALKGSRNAIK